MIPAIYIFFLFISISYQRNLVYGLVGEFLLMAAVTAAAMLHYHTLVGVFCHVFNVIMYGSPLAIMVSKFKFSKLVANN